MYKHFIRCNYNLLETGGRRARTILLPDFLAVPIFLLPLVPMLKPPLREIVPVAVPEPNPAADVNVDTDVGAPNPPPDSVEEAELVGGIDVDELTPKEKDDVAGLIVFNGSCGD